MDITVKEGAIKVGRAVYKKPNGIEGRIDVTNSGPPVWTNSNPAACDMVVAEDGMSATITALAEGDSHFEAVADGDLSIEGQRFVVAAGNVHVEAAEVATGDIEFTDPA